MYNTRSLRSSPQPASRHSITFVSAECVYVAGPVLGFAADIPANTWASCGASSCPPSSGACTTCPQWCPLLSVLAAKERISSYLLINHMGSLFFVSLLLFSQFLILCLKPGFLRLLSHSSKRSTVILFMSVALVFLQMLLITIIVSPNQSPFLYLAV